MNKKGTSVLVAGWMLLTTVGLTGCSIGGGGGAGATNNTVTTPSGGDTNTSQNVAAAGNSTSNAGGTAVPSTGGGTQPAQGTAGNSTVTVGSGTTSIPAASTSAFPNVVRMAMGRFSSTARIGAQAPTMYPKADSGTNVLYYHTTQSMGPRMGFPGLAASYNVMFSSPTNPVASFSGARYDSAAHAAQGFDSIIGGVNVTEGSKVDLGHGITGHLTADSSAPSATFSWSEGRWQIRVTNHVDAVEPTATAREVVNYLNAHFMPVPRDRATITVDSDSTGFRVLVAWQETNELYQVETYAHCKDPIETALAMAIAMRPYK